MNPEFELSGYDPFQEALQKYMRDVGAFALEGESGYENNYDRIRYAFFDLLESVGVADDDAIVKMDELLPRFDGLDLGLDELGLQYKLAPLRLMHQLQPDCVLPLEKLTTDRIRTTFNLSLAGEQAVHNDCIAGGEGNQFLCRHALTCPILVARRIGKDMLELLEIQQMFFKHIEPEVVLDNENLRQLKQTLRTHDLMTSMEIEVYLHNAAAYAREQVMYIFPPQPRLNEEAEGTN